MNYLVPVFTLLIVLVAQANASKCLGGPVVGPCRAGIRRYYYDAATDECYKFLYGGCNGSDNRYNTYAECKASCVSKCSGKPERGPCRGALRRYYYNQRLNKCLPFIYGGCKGNANRYLSVRKCEASCM